MARPLPRFDRDQEQQEDAERIARILEESPEVAPVTGATAAGDERTSVDDSNGMAAELVSSQFRDSGYRARCEWGTSRLESAPLDPFERQDVAPSRCRTTLRRRVGDASTS